MRDSIAVKLPIEVDRLPSDTGAASLCGQRCRFRTLLNRNLGNTVEWCALFHEDVDSGKRTPTCVAAANAAGDDPYVVQS